MIGRDVRVPPALALETVTCEPCYGTGDAYWSQGELEPCCLYCWGVGEVEIQRGPHADWCHIDLDCCGCNCRNAYTDYYERKRIGAEDADGEVPDPARTREPWTTDPGWPAVGQGES
jgi:hypothetical protein